MLKPKKNLNVRDRGNAAWCVRKHCGGALRHATETNQKLGRNIKGDRIKLDKPTQDEANAIIYDLDQIEYHIQMEVLPQVKNASTKRKLRSIDKKARKIRQDIAKTGIIFYDTKKVDSDAMETLEGSVWDLQQLIREIDKTASHIMTQEQVNCEKCVEDLVGIDGLKAMKKNEKTKKKDKRKKDGLFSRVPIIGNLGKKKNKKKGKKKRK